MMFSNHSGARAGTFAAATTLGGALMATALALCSAFALLPSTASAAPGGQSLGSLQSQAAQVQTEVKSLDSRAEAAVEKYDVARAQLDQLNAQLMETRRDLDRAETQLDVARSVYGARMADIYKNGGVTVLDVLLAAGDFTDIDTQIDYFRDINRADADTVNNIEALAKSVAKLEGQVEQQRAAALTKEMDLREKQADVEDQLAARKALLADLNSQVKALLARQARLDAAASRKLAHVADLRTGTIRGTPVQIALVKETMKYLGIPYVWAGATPSGGFDCSGLVLYVYAKFGVDFPHGATMQAHMGTPVPFDKLEPADLVFFGYPAFYHHVGIYIGNGLFIEAPHTGDVVKVSVLAGRGAALACRYPIRLQ
jgi:peptidoglycan DL-endopeptidase CwlO